MRKLTVALAGALLVAGCYTRKPDGPVPEPTPTPKPPEPVVGLVTFADISGNDAGGRVTDLMAQKLRAHLKVKRLPMTGFLNEEGLAKALRETYGGPVIQGRVSAYDFQRRSSRRMGPPDYDAVEARAVVSLSLRVGAVTAEAPEGALVWSRSLLGEDHAVWAENFRQEIGANPLVDSYLTPGGLTAPRSAAQMLGKAAERAIEMVLPDLLRQLERSRSVVTGQ